MQSVSVFSPGSVTCFFEPRRGATPEETVSPGCGIALRHGVTTHVEPAARDEVLLNGRPITMEPVNLVLRRLAPEPVRVWVETPLALGCGFGVSACAALTTAFALAARYDLPLSREQLGLVAHAAEVSSGTGVGDVGTQLCGGVVHRRCLRGPLDCVRLDVPSGPLYYRVFGPMSTAEVLRSENTVAALRRESPRALQWLESQTPPLDVGAILDRSLEFCRRTGLLDSEPVIRAIEDVRRCGGHASMILLGHSVLATRRPDIEPEAWTQCEIDTQGTRRP
jgi:pantoate kinase